MTQDEGVRLQKVIAQAGVASRRRAEELIAEGRVEVNGRVVQVQGRRVDPERDVIRVDGERIPPRAVTRTWCSTSPGCGEHHGRPAGRPTVAEHLGRWRNQRLFHVGRLDADSEGMLLLTNDGDFAQAMTHPSYELPKTYVVEVEGVVERPTVRRLAKGIRLEDGPIRPDSIRVDQVGRDRTMLTVVIHSGRNRVVRRMFEAVGHPVRRLARVKIGPVALGDVKLGKVRELTGPELGRLMDAVEM